MTQEERRLRASVAANEGWARNIMRTPASRATSSMLAQRARLQLQLLHSRRIAAEAQAAAEDAETQLADLDQATA